MQVPLIILQQCIFCIFIFFPNKPDEDWYWLGSSRRSDRERDGKWERERLEQARYWPVILNVVYLSLFHIV